MTCRVERCGTPSPRSIRSMVLSDTPALKARPSRLRRFASRAWTTCAVRRRSCRNSSYGLSSTASRRTRRPWPARSTLSRPRWKPRANSPRPDTQNCCAHWIGALGELHKEPVQLLVILAHAHVWGSAITPDDQPERCWTNVLRYCPHPEPPRFKSITVARPRPSGPLSG
jgi:hypothetical protein